MQFFGSFNPKNMHNISKKIFNFGLTVDGSKKLNDKDFKTTSLKNGHIFKIFQESNSFPSNDVLCAFTVRIKQKIERMGDKI